MKEQKQLGALLVGVWLVCAALLLNGAVIRIPPSRPGAIRVQTAGVVARTGTAAYVNGSFSDESIFTANWITGGSTNGTVTWTPGFLKVSCTAWNYTGIPRALVSGTQSGDFDVEVSCWQATEKKGTYCLMYYVADDTFLEMYRTWDWDPALEYIGAYCMNGGSWVLNGQWLRAINDKRILRIARIGNVWSAGHRNGPTDSWTWTISSQTIALPTGGRVGCGAMFGTVASPSVASFTNFVFNSGAPQTVW